MSSENILQSLSDDEKKKLKKKKQPEFIKPMLATLTKEHFSDPEWIYERKLDGERCLAFKKQKKVRLMSRNEKEINASYPEIIEALEKADVENVVLDGEIVAFEGNVTSFSRLQDRMNVKDPEEARATNVKIYYYIFDIPYAAGYDISNLPLESRKKILKQILSFSNPLRFTRHRNEKGEEFLSEACKKGWEGLIAKKKGSGYSHTRSKNWLKFKCVKRQEFVIGGWTDPQGSRKGFGAILIGYYKNDAFMYAGKVGTGFDDKTLTQLKKRSETLSRKRCPFNEPDKIGEKDAHWIKPELVAQIGFTEWTDDGKLRHPRYRGLRRDKKPQDVIKET